MSVIESGFTKDGAVAGPARVLYAPTSVAVPAGLDSIINLVADANLKYPPKTGWLDFGLSAGGNSYARNFDTEGMEYEQPSTLLFERISDIQRSMTVNMASIKPEHLKIIEQAPNDATTKAAGANVSAQKVLKAGAFSDRTPYRIAIIEQRDPDAVLVTEPGGRTRGGLVARVLLRARIAADEAEIESAKNDPTNVDVQFTAFPEDGLPLGEEYVHHYFEQAGTISAV